MIRKPTWSVLMVAVAVVGCGGGTGTDTYGTDAAEDKGLHDPGEPEEEVTDITELDACIPDCIDRECGNDGCGGNCGSCLAGRTCIDGKCWTPQCSNGMCLVPDGPYWMGCNPTVDPWCFGGTASPKHEVIVPAFQIDELEVTLAEYSQCVESGTCLEPPAYDPETFDAYPCYWKSPFKMDTHPINCVKWALAKQYCEWAGKRLCTEAEWEKAARGTDSRVFPWGNEEATCDLIVMGFGCSEPPPYAVGTIPQNASPYGPLDMSGNMAEWVEDWFHDGYSGSPSDGSAWLEPVTSERVMRGGSYGYLDDPEPYTTYWRTGMLPEINWPDHGIRCCQSVTD